MPTQVTVERTRSGLPALWEEGGGMTNTGRARIIAGPRGEPKAPVYVRRRGHLALGEHALFVINPGDHYITAYHHRGDFRVQVYQILQIQDDSATLELVAEYDMGEWAPPPPPYLEAAIQAAMAKATCYHCREAHYARGEVAR